MRGVVYQSRHAKLLFDALRNPDHELRQAAEEAIRGFAEAVAKEKGVLIQEASQLYGIPARTIAGWVDIGLIPVLSRGKKAVYLDAEVMAAAAPLYYEAKEKGEQPAKLLKARLGQPARGNPQQPH